jgi:hypothetical protein
MIARHVCECASCSVRDRAPCRREAARFVGGSFDFSGMWLCVECYDACREDARARAGTDDVSHGWSHPPRTERDA